MGIVGRCELGPQVHEGVQQVFSKALLQIALFLINVLLTVTTTPCTKNELRALTFYSS